LWAGHAARIRETRKTYRIVVVKPLGKWPLGRSTTGVRGNVHKQALVLLTGFMYRMSENRRRKRKTRRTETKEQYLHYSTDTVLNKSWKK
jgi:hypothetical protein